MRHTGALATLTDIAQPIDMELLLKGFPHFREIYEELVREAPHVALMRPVQEALLALRECDPHAFKESGKVSDGRLPDIETAFLRSAFKAIRKDEYLYTQKKGHTKKDQAEEKIPIDPFIFTAFNMVYGATCSADGIKRRLFETKRPKQDGIQLMIAITRMLHAFWRNANKPRTVPQPV